jgi:3-oxoadipate enol-lactonase
MLHARDVGHGQAVVLLHAFPMNSRMWEPQIEALRGRWRVIAPDFPGFGLSGAPAETPSLEQYASGVVTLLKQLHVENAVVVGLSMGGYVAFRLVNELGPRLRGLLLADTRPTADTEEAVVARHELAAEVEAEGVEAAASEFLPKLLGSTTLRMRPSLIDRVRAIMLENTVPGVAGALRAMAGRGDVSALLPRIRCPVICVAGEEDIVTPPDVARATAEKIPAARAEIIPQAGHLTNLEAPEAFNDILAQLLAVAHPA